MEKNSKFVRAEELLLERELAIRTALISVSEDPSASVTQLGLRQILVVLNRTDFLGSYRITGVTAILG